MIIELICGLAVLAGSYKACNACIPKPNDEYEIIHIITYSEEN